MPEINEACCFTGHRPQKLPWRFDEGDPLCISFKEKLAVVIEAVYESGIRHFISGMALGCDIYCAEAVIALKRAHPDITLEAAVPFSGQSEKWSRSARLRYDRILSLCDRVTLIQQDYTAGCMMRRNRYMVDNSSVLIACYDEVSGGTWNTIDYAQYKGIEIIQLPLM